MRDRTERERGLADARIEREEDDSGVGKTRPQRLRDLEPGHPWHRVVEDDQIRLELQRHARGFVSVRGLADDLEFGLGVDERAQSLADRRVVIRDEHPRGHRVKAAFCDPSRHPTTEGRWYE